MKKEDWVLLGEETSFRRENRKSGQKDIQGQECVCDMSVIYISIGMCLKYGLY